jgi:hypothetical protein
MKFRELTYSRGATINMGNYNNVRLEVTASVTLDASDDPDKSFVKLRAWVEQHAAEEARRYQSKG